MAVLFDLLLTITERNQEPVQQDCIMVVKWEEDHQEQIQVSGVLADSLGKNYTSYKPQLLIESQCEPHMYYKILVPHF